MPGRACARPWSPELAAYEHLDVVAAARASERAARRRAAISYDGAAGELVVERAAGGVQRGFASVSRVAVPLVDGGCALEVWVDRCSVEVFADDGRVVLTYLVFPRAAQHTEPKGCRATFLVE